MNFSAFVQYNLSLILIAAVALGYLFIAIFPLSIAVVCMPLHRRLIRTMPAWISTGMITPFISGAVVGIGVAVVLVLLFDTEYLLSVLRVMTDTLFRILGTVGGDAAAGSVAGALGSMIIATFPKFIPSPNSSRYSSSTSSSSMRSSAASSRSETVYGENLVCSPGECNGKRKMSA
ncbi:MAG: hypothetical protein MJ014_01940 [Methanocorpusculum sp.]|nr:hypothetical protein [Methanocorpusculum sp.]